MAESYQTGQKTLWIKEKLLLRAISPFSTLFLKDLYGKHEKTRDCLGKGQLFIKQQNFRPVQFERLCRQQYRCNFHNEFHYEKNRKHCVKRRKCWLPAFSPFPTMFSKSPFLKVIKSRDCEVKTRGARVLVSLHRPDFSVTMKRRF